MKLKAFFFVAAFCFFSAEISALSEFDSDSADSAEIFSGDSGDSDDDDFDSVFDDSADIQVEQSDASAYVDSRSKLALKIGDSVPLKFSGSLDTSLGFYLTRLQKEESSGRISPSAYFDFTNYLNFVAKIDRNLSVRGVTYVYFPPVGASNASIKLSSLYFDYLVFDRIYITAGKKSTTWGYTRLFSGEDAYSLYSDKNYNQLTDDEKEAARKKIENQGFLYTNVLSDSSSGVSGIVRIPFWTGEISGVVLYKGSDTEPTASSLIGAASVEFTLFHATFNFFGRKDEGSGKSVPLTAGVEAKRTFWGTDVYAQGIGKLNEEKNDFSKMVFTGGFYRIWDGHDPNFGLNFEIQDSYNKELGKNSCRTYLDMGLKRLGKNHDMKIALSWQHIIKSDNNDEKSGIVKFGFAKSGLFPHATWNNGIEVKYHPKDESYASAIYSVRFGSYISISADY